MSGKHTPGPWTLDGCVSLGNLDVIYASGRITMMDCENDEVDDDTLLANARLIAAAPDLLAALNQIIELERRGGSSQSIRLVAAAAIKQARGEA